MFSLCKWIQSHSLAIGWNVANFLALFALISLILYFYLCDDNRFSEHVNKYAADGSQSKNQLELNAILLWNFKTWIPSFSIVEIPFWLIWNWLIDFFLKQNWDILPHSSQGNAKCIISEIGHLTMWFEYSNWDFCYFLCRIGNDVWCRELINSPDSSPSRTKQFQRNTQPIIQYLMQFIFI